MLLLAGARDSLDRGGIPAVRERPARRDQVRRRARPAPQAGQQVRLLLAQPQARPRMHHFEHLNTTPLTFATVARRSLSIPHYSAHMSMDTIFLIAREATQNCRHREPHS